MKKYSILLWALAALAAASCTEKEEIAPASGKVTREFSTVLTKTTLHTDGQSVYWEEGDAISVFDGVENNKFDILGYDNGSPSASATFSGSVDGGASVFYAVYPYDAGNSFNSGTSTVTATVPAAQTLKAGSFQSGAAVAVARTTTNSLSLHNATALLGITLTAEMTDVESIEFSGNNDEYVAGPVSATLNGSGAVTAITPGTGSKTVTLTGTFAASGTYYLSFIPQTFTKGVKVIVTFDGGKTAIATSSKSLATEAGTSYNIANFTRVTLPSATFGAKNSFNYDSGAAQNLAPVSYANIASITVDSAPAGWDIAWNTDHFEVTPPTQAEIQTTPQTVDPDGTFEITLRSAAGHTREVSIPVRLYGINSLAEWNAFRTAYGPTKDDYTAGTSYSSRCTSCADYMVDSEITLNKDLTLAAATNFYFHNIEHSINGNNRTLTLSISGSAWPIGLCQFTYGSPVVHDINLAGALNWTYAVNDATNAGCAGGFVAKVAGGTLTFTNVNSSINITWNSAAVATPTKHHSMGGLVGSSQGFTITFNNCTVSGSLSRNRRALTIGGFIGWNSGANKTYFNNCVFDGSISQTATDAKADALATNGNLDFIGGFVGNTDGNASGLVQIKASTMSGTITVAGGAKNLGGFIGKSACPTSIGDDALGNHSQFAGTIDYTENEAPSTSNTYGLVGGFIGAKTGNSLSIVNCVSTSGSEVKISGGAARVGGFIGDNSVDGITFSGNTFGGKVTYISRGEVTGNATEYVGGFIGHMGGTGTTFSSCISSGNVTITKGAIAVGGFTGNQAGAITFNTCDLSGKVDFTVYTTLPTDGNKANECGRIGGFVGQMGTNNVSFTACSVTSTGKVISNGDISTSGGFVGNGGNNTALASFENCAFHGTLTHTAASNTGARRFGGIIADASRQASLTNCSNDGTMNLYERGKGTAGFGGLVGRTTAQSGTVGNPYTMSCTISSCTFSGTMNVYALTQARATSLSTAQAFGTLIGSNAGYAVTSIEGEYKANSNSVNYEVTSVNFLVE